MTKFTDKLSRLHASRVRALDTDQPNAPRVYVADEVPEVVPSRAPATEQSVPQSLFANEAHAVAAAGKNTPPAAPTGSTEPARVDSPARKAVREQLELGRRVRKTPPRVRMQRGAPVPEQADFDVEPAHSVPAVDSVSENAVGERLAMLRVRVEALIGAGGLESALPLLHEMVALSPTHPYPLTQLAAYWRQEGNQVLAELYAGRLAAVAPY